MRMINTPDRVFSVAPNRFLVVIPFLCVACQVNLTPPSAVAAIHCAATTDCPTGFVCLLEQQWCKIATDPCVTTVAGNAVAVTDGNICTLAAGGEGICLDASCVVSTCGDGFVDVRSEECDEGSANAALPNACRPNCEAARCGDGITDAGETCDDGNDSDEDSCLSATHSTPCQANRCGDGVPNVDSTSAAVEECDDGNLIDDDACLRSCIWNRCEDGYLNPLEETCDDGNPWNNDGCVACATTTWESRIVAGFRNTRTETTSLPLAGPSGVAVAPDGQVYVSDIAVSRLYRIDLEAGFTALFAGTGENVDSGDRGPAALAGLCYPDHVATDALGNVYVVTHASDSWIGRLRRVDASGVIDTIAGLGDSQEDGAAAQDLFLQNVGGLAVDGWGRIYVSTNAPQPRVVSIDPDIFTTATVVGGGGESLAAGEVKPATDLNLPAVGPLAVYGSFLYVGSSWWSGPEDLLFRVDLITGDAILIAGGGVEPPGPSPQSATDVELTMFFGVAATDERVFVSVGEFMGPQTVLEIHAGQIRTLTDTTETGFAGDGGPIASAQFSYLDESTIDQHGQLLLTDSGNHRIRRLTTEGIVATILGEAESARLESPRLAKTVSQVDAPALTFHGDELYGCFFGRNILAKIRPDGLAVRLAGTGMSRNSGDGGPAAAASIAACSTAVVALDGSVIVTAAHCVRRIRPDGIIETIAGSCDAGGNTGDGGPAGDARLSAPNNLVLRPNGDVWVADSNNACVRSLAASAGVISASSTISTVAGTCGALGDEGDGGPATAATLERIDAMSQAVDGWVYVAAANKVRGISDAGTIDTVVGGGTATAEGTAASEIQLPDLRAAAFGPNNNLYLTTRDERVLRVAAVDLGGGTMRISGSSPVTTVMGAVDESDSYGDGGPAAAARIAKPSGIAVSDDGAIHVANGDWQNDSYIRRIDPDTGVVMSIAGPVLPIGDGPIAESQLGGPMALASFASPGQWLIADGGTGRLRLVDETAGTVTTVLGYPSVGSRASEGPALEVLALSFASGIAYASDAELIYACDRDGHRVLRIAAGAEPWMVSTLAGGQPGFAVGPLSESRFREPSGLLLVGDDLYVAERGNNLIRRIDLAAQTSTVVAGVPGRRGFAGDGGPATEALLYQPVALALGRGGNLYIADQGNHRVRRIDPAGTITTVVGVGEPGNAGNGVPAASFPIQQPAGLAVDSDGNLFIAAGSMVRRVIAGDDQIATGTDRLDTIYGEPPGDRFPEPVTKCLSGLLLEADEASLMVLDACQGMLVRLERQRHTAD